MVKPALKPHGTTSEPREFHTSGSSCNTGSTVWCEWRPRASWGRCGTMAVAKVSWKNTKKNGGLMSS